MIELTPEARGRIAFAALLGALCLMASDRTVATGDPSPLFVLAPPVATLATGHVTAREAFVRAGIAVFLMFASGLLVNLSHGRGVPDYQGTSVLLSALTGLLALNLALIVGTSFILRRVWPASDHWTR